MEWDRGDVYTSDVLGPNQLQETRSSSNENHRVLEKKYQLFFEHFRIDEIYTYREQLRRNLHLKQYYLVVHLGHLLAYDENLANQLQNNPAEMTQLMEEAAKKLSIQLISEESATDINNGLGIQIQIISNIAEPIPLRQLESTKISKMVRISGIVISASTPIAKPTSAYIVCKSCSNSRYIAIHSSFGGVNLPRTCTGSGGEIINKTVCPLDPFVILPDKCKCVDQQTLKLQESPDMVPVGELPRHVILTVDRYLVNKVSPGNRMTINGMYSIFQSRSTNVSGVAIRSPYIKVLGIELDSDGSGRSSKLVFNEEQERQMIAFSRQPSLYDRIAKSIAPSIYGNEDIKKAIACLLFGGSRKFLPDRMKLRGDINVLLLGDPGTAKSQFLKFVEKASPICVYTSGKGSSAAGLTASVIRDPGSGDFYLEGGAMVLADGGVVCIDEFDKMRDEDRVAIHEAMEQQTISIAKAGITTVLNSRTSVFAAANPIFGRYDEMKAPGENIDFSTTILSRFDMLFIIKDDHNQTRDISLARHVLSVHMNPNALETGTNDIDLNTLKSYIAYCKSKCAPRLSPKAAAKLSDHYVAMRSEMHAMEMNSYERSSIPITVRQLEAIIRISEALAKITLSPVATEEHVDEAVRLFKVSTMQAVQSGHSIEGMSRAELVREVEKVEKAIKQRIPIGSSVSYANLLRELTMNKGFSEHAAARCIDVMVAQEKLLFKTQRKILVRQL